MSANHFAIGSDLCKALGLDGSDVMKLTIVATRDQVLVTAESFLSMDGVAGIETAFREYHLVEVDKPALVPTSAGQGQDAVSGPERPATSIDNDWSRNGR